MEGLPMDVRTIDKQELVDVDEAFITSIAGDIIPVTRVNRTPLENGAPGLATTHFAETYWARCAEGWHASPVADILTS